MTKSPKVRSVAPATSFAEVMEALSMGSYVLVTFEDKALTVIGLKTLEEQAKAREERILDEKEVLEWIKGIMAEGTASYNMGFTATAPMDAPQYGVNLKAYLFRVGYELERMMRKDK